MQKLVLLGDEAIAQGAIDAGLSGIYAYPGTPSTEITEYVQRSKQAKEKNIKSTWSVNEKTAMEGAIGMSYAGKRAMVCMKHVGLNVAADPFINSAITGANGGLIVVSADDPSMHSSQNEQDSRVLGKFALIPMLEPVNQQEAYDMVFYGFEISEKYGTPVMIRITTRLAHSRAGVVRKEIREQNTVHLPNDHRQYVLLPAIAKKRYKILLQNQQNFDNESETSGFNMYIGGKDKSLGIIAGNRSLPLLFAGQARSMGVKRIVAVAFDGETDPKLESLVDEIVWLKVGQLSKMISAFATWGVKQCVMVGQIAPKNLFDIRPDLRAAAMLLRLREKNAHTIFGAIAEELKKDGVELIEATPWLKPLMPAAGFSFGPKLNERQRADAEFGFRIAREVSRLEIGQLVVVKEGTVLAVEAFEGTDRCLARGGELAGKSGGAVAVKVAKEKHDLRFDIPCLGPKTLETCAASGISVMAFEAGKSLVLEQEACERLAVKNKICLTTVG